MGSETVLRVDSDWACSNKLNLRLSDMLGLEVLFFGVEDDCAFSCEASIL